MTAIGVPYTPLPDGQGGHFLRRAERGQPHREAASPFGYNRKCSSTLVGIGVEKEGSGFVEPHQATTPQQQWTEFQAALQSRVTPVTWQTWLEPLQLDELTEERIRLLAPSEFHLRWVREKYLSAISDALGAAFGEGVVVELEANPGPFLTDLDLDEEVIDRTVDTTPVPGPARDEDALTLVPKYQFENFVVGPSNRFAHAAAMAVSE